MNKLKDFKWALGIFLSLMVFGVIADTGRTIFQTDILQFGRASNADKSLVFKRAALATSPSLKWNESTAAIQFSNDGTLFNNVASATDINDPKALVNFGFDASVSSNTMIVSIKGKNGAAPSSSNIVRVSFHNTSANAAGYTQVDISSPLQLTIPNGATLGHASGVDSYIYVYLLNNAGSPEIAVSSALIDEGSLHSTTAISGGSSVSSVLYSQAARSNKFIRLIGRIKNNQPTAGTYTVGPTEWGAPPFYPIPRAMEISSKASYDIARHPKMVFGVVNCAASPSILIDPFGTISSVTRNGSGDCTVDFSVGFTAAPTCMCTIYNSSTNGFCLQPGGTSAGGFRILGSNDNGGASDRSWQIVCFGY